MTSRKTCAVCSSDFDAKRAAAKYCGERCRKRAQRRPGRTAGQIVALPGGRQSSDRSVESLYDTTLEQLVKAGRESSALGVAALLAATRLDSVGLTDTGAGVAALLKAHREALAEAVRDAKQESDPLEKIRQSAALKLLMDVG